MKFNELNLIRPILKAVEYEGYEEPSPIQKKAIPLLLEGKDLFGCAQTGTGKTAAFAIPILQMLYEQRLAGSPPNTLQALVLTPTRELAAQVAQSFKAYGRFTRLKTTVIFGGVGQAPQVAALKAGVDILVATPGRLNDLINQGLCDLSHVSMFVLDEADRMLDMGFIHDVKKVIAKLPKERQTLLFSATMPKEIKTLASSILRNPVTVAVTPVSSTVDTITQCVYFVDKTNKGRLLIELLKSDEIVSALLFSRTKHGADRIKKILNKAGITAGAIHGDKSQAARERALADFKAGRTRILVATDIAARGIDIDQLSHVINYDLPNEPETYVHRIGRTGRAGLGGDAISFCDFGEKAYLADIQKLIGKKITVVEDHPYPMEVFEVIQPQTRPRRTPAEREARTPRSDDRPIVRRKRRRR
ncbi:MAG: DEAD/DEAH box helicase [Oscillospiraceae bacterium]